MVAGSVNKISSGFTIASSTANTRATITAVTILLFIISTPGNIAASTKTFTAVINILNKKFIRVFCFSIKNKQFYFRAYFFVFTLQLIRKNLQAVNIYLQVFLILLPKLF